MFDINSGELLIIALVALMVFGPQRLPELLKKAGSFIREMRAMGAELQKGLERDLAELKEPVQTLKDDLTKPVTDIKDDLTKPVKDIKDDLAKPVKDIKDDLTKPVTDLNDDLTKPGQELADSVDTATQHLDESVSGLRWNGPIPESGPTPDDAMVDLDRIEAGENLLEETEE